MALSSNLSAAESVLFEKQDGSFWLIVWQAAQSYNPATNTAITVPPISGSVTFASAPATLKTYTFNPATGAVTTSTLASSKVAAISVTDTPLILQIGTAKTAPILATPQPPVY